MSDGVLSASSPPQSRSSSAQDSYSTSATTYEDSADASGSNSEKRASVAEAKGNVVVSVRVRPDSTNDNHTDGEWMVDGRRSLIGYKGKEGGDYYYGM
jgi:centromeric protein E